MTATAIRVEHLSKQYKIGALRQRNETLRQALSAGARSLIRRGGASGSDTSFFALNDVSFDVAQGDVVGVIGRNGAGKSTLLKILSRITPPTSGSVELRGRVGSLLEVGMGFDRELTGRENTYLNGAILGMRKREIDRKFDEIVSFAEIEQFIDTPVKRYSSGMYTRLAFAVAAHLEPEILIVDEVLAVGDAKFQARCLGKMGEVASHGRTVLFVSHNMSAIANFCPRAIWLEKGRVREIGRTNEIVSRYLADGGGNGGAVEFEPDTAPGSDAARLLAVRARNSAGVSTTNFSNNEAITVEVEYETLRRTAGLRIGLTLLGREGEVILSTKDLDVYPTNFEREPGRYVSRCTLPADLLNAGRFFLTVGSDIPMVQSNFSVDRVLSFTVELSGDSVGGVVPDNRVGLLRMKMPWSIERAG
jgi:lipopolysaccharide transport system ATP-binding protein